MSISSDRSGVLTAFEKAYLKFITSVTRG